MYEVFGIGAFQSLVFSVLLLMKREDKPADKFLSGFFFVVTLYLLNIYSIKFLLWKQFPDILIIYSFVFLSYGPLLYLYVSSLLGKKITIKQILAHSIPIIVVLLIIFPFLFEDREVKLLCFTDKFMNMPLNISIGSFLQYLSSPIYFVWILMILRKYKSYVKDNYSSDEKINLNWMNKLLIGGISIWLIECLNVIALNFTELDFPYTYNTSWYIKFAFMIFVLFIGYYGINQGGIFSKTKEEEKKSEELIRESKIQSDTVVEKNKLISEEAAKQYKTELIKYIEEEQVYLNSELRIQDVSIHLKIPVHILSYIINSELQQNFYDFINLYRIEEVKKRLHNTEYDNLTIIAIAIDCGFNSKATFNRLFKLYTGTTPSLYKKNSN